MAHFSKKSVGNHFWSIALFFASVLSAHPQVTDASLDFFEKQIRPILANNCYECHSSRSKNLKGGLHLDSRAGLEKGGDSGPVISQDNPIASRLLQAVQYRDRDLQMPPKNRLKDAEIAALEQWIKRGAPHPESDNPPATSKIQDRDVKSGRNFWAFKPVGNPPVPESALAKNWAINPVDNFIADPLHTRQIKPAPMADKRTLIRRATYDLIGLPPTAEEVDAFAADTSTNAFAKVIDRLLDSPQYGVRWGRHWLDVARYADSNGLDENLAFGNAWRYRDYVIDSFNADKPFDRFLIEQIAGDLLPGANRETKIATGFLALGAKVLAEKDMEKLVMDVIDEQIDTVGKAFMGLTLGCARCHDHKFDPISQSDYYGLAAIFKSTRTFAGDGRGAIKYWFEHEFATDEEKEQVKAFETELAAKKKIATNYKNSAIGKLRAQARDKAADYLAAATGFDSSASLESVAEIAAPLDLHPRILHHCRLHLSYHRTDPLFAVWRKHPGDQATIRDHYGRLFDRVSEAFALAQKKDPKINKLEEPDLEAARAALNDPSGFLAVPSIPAHAFDSATLAEYERLEEVARVFESGGPDLSAAMGVADAEIVEAIPLHIRGSHINLGNPVHREFPEILRLSTVRPILPSNQSGRLQFAKWIADTRNPLTARVFVNRLWRWHFGRGLVSTTENFGLLGDRPSHPELLDWLAHHFMRGGWKVKDLHRLIMLSATYQMNSTHPEEAAAARLDPGNAFWWRFERQRLEAEQIRDGILAVAGRLEMALGGKTIPLRNRQFVFNHTSEDHTGYEKLHRRAAYLPVVRNHLCDIFQQFDYPDPATPTGSRNTTVVAPQALLLMNSPLVMDAADTIAADLIAESEVSDSTRITLAYRRIFARPPSPDETKRALVFLDGAIGEPPLTDAANLDPVAAAKSRREAWTLFFHTLLAANEFVYLN
jgi:mono/diheme cytochrome c family protein